MPLASRITSIALITSAALLAGCNIAIPIAYAIEGPPKVQAFYEPDTSRTTVILIDDPGNRMPRRELRLIAGQIADEDLMRSKTYAAGKLISSKSALNAAKGAEPGPKLSVVDIGRRVGAEVVIYAKVVDWSLSPDGQKIAPRTVVNVRLFDTLNNERIFPDEGGFPITAELPEESLTKQINKNVVEKNLASALGLALSRAFYEHERPKLQNRRPTLE
ncbi:MAG: hypothetical protein ACKVZJ_02430 [Phycisphaerales bacterium]